MPQKLDLILRSARSARLEGRTAPMPRPWKPVSEFVHKLESGNDNEENHWNSAICAAPQRKVAMPPRP